MNKQEKIFANVVTFNRLCLLKGCLSSIFSQSKRLNKIIVVNNNSNDGTKEYLEDLKKSHKELLIINLNKNLGSSGGQNEGFKKAYSEGADWVWTMDDDTIPETNALEELIKAKEILFEKKIDVGFLSSNVFGRSGKPLNVPLINLKKSENKYNNWPLFLENSLIPINISTFVSLFVSRKAIKNCGYPIKEFFIWNDDTNYTLRISKKFDCYCVGKSKVLHKRIPEKALDIFSEENVARIQNFQYSFRNSSYTLIKEKNILRYILFLFNSLRKSFKALFCKKFPLIKSMSILRGLIQGIFFNPKIEYPK